MPILRPLHDAASAGYEDIVPLLLDGGANIEVIDWEGGGTVLHLAVADLSDSVINLLLKRHVNIEVKDKVGRIALQIGAALSTVPTVRTLLCHGANVNAVDFNSLHLAAEKANLANVNILLNHEANIDAISTTAGTALHVAVSDGEIDIVHELLHRPANTEILNTDGNARRCVLSRWPSRFTSRS